jgi:4-hydroxybenzoate polyprenyltransferase
MTKIVEYARLLRFPGLGGLAIPVIIGAITVNQNLDLYYYIILFVIGSLSSIYGFVLNDYADINVDKLSEELHERPLVKGIISPNTAVIICCFSVAFTFLMIFLLFYGKTVDIYRFMAVIVIVFACILGTIYNFFGKRFAGSDFLVALSVSFVFLFGALSVGQPNLFTWIIFVLTFNNLFHMNAIEGGIKDSDHDYKHGVKNIALFYGVKVDDKNIYIPVKLKIFSISIRLFSAFLLLSPFVFYNINYYLWQIVILILMIIGVLYFSIRLLSIKIFNRNQIRKYIATQSFLRYSLVPIMLISTIGVLYSLILIIFPILWYIIFTLLLGENLLKPKM